MSSKPSIIRHLEMVAPVLPAPIYWLDTNSRLLGANNVFLQAIGASGLLEQWIGKSAYDVYPLELADMIIKHNEEVMKTGIISGQEETIRDISKGILRYFVAVKSPLYDDSGNVIGLVGTSIEITAQKEAERREIEAQKTVLQEKEKLITLAHTVAHDISSPLSALSMMMPFCDELPESKRSLIKRAIQSILDIANNLLSTYRSDEQYTASTMEQRQPVLVSDAIAQIVSEKKAQYSNHTVRFAADIADEAQFAFAYLHASSFKRSLSNLINNAVDALDNKEDGVVTIHPTADADLVVVEIQDNGKGMPDHLIEKMSRRQRFTEGKQGGHGLGLQQVWDTLDDNQGTIKVRSVPDQGTTIQLSFPRIAAPSWIAQTIHLSPNSIIVILDDEESIHGAWDMRLMLYLQIYPNLEVHHFKQGRDVLNFLSKLNADDKNCVVLLSDYELLRQNKNGLQIIEERKIKNTILVTSYYSNSAVRDKAIQLGGKILPKQMASIVPITTN